MRALRLLMLLLLASTLPGATDIQSYLVRLRASENGSGQAMATVVLTGCTPGRLDLPLGFPTAGELRLLEPVSGVQMEQISHRGISILRFMLPEGFPPQATLRFSFTVREVFQPIKSAPGEKATLPAGSRLFRHAFVNTQEAPIGTYRLELLFSEGTMAQAIREQLPKPTKSEVGPRVLLCKLEGHQAAVLQYSQVDQGDDTSMVLELVPARKSLAWLIVGLLLSGVYLYYFRDLVAPRRP